MIPAISSPELLDCSRWGSQQSRVPLELPSHLQLKALYSEYSASVLAVHTSDRFEQTVTLMMSTGHFYAQGH